VPLAGSLSLPISATPCVTPIFKNRRNKLSQNLKFRIRPGTKSDIPAIFELVKKLAEYERLSHQVSATEQLYLKNGFGPKKYFETLIAEELDSEKKQAIGFALYFYTFSTFVGRPTLYLEDLFVLPELRGQGVGKNLLKELAIIARDSDCGRMEWAVLNWNEPAIQFYKKLGAAPLDDWTVYRLNAPEIKKLAEEEHKEHSA
jgi:GNAT superfamily N-acetyltransferase